MSACHGIRRRRIEAIAQYGARSVADFAMPPLGADVDAGTLREWLVGAGDEVGEGDPVAVVEAADSTIEVEAPVSGTVQRPLVDAGMRVPVGTPLARIVPSEVMPEKQGGAAAPTTGPTAVTLGPLAPPAPEDAHTEVGPLVRHLAERRGVDLDTVEGSGRGGRVTRADVDQAIDAIARPPHIPATPLAQRLADVLSVDLGTVRGTGAEGVVRASDVRRAAASRSTAPSPRGAPPPVRPSERGTRGIRQAKAGPTPRTGREAPDLPHVPHYALSTTVDMVAAMDWLHDHNGRCPATERLRPSALLLKAAALAAREVPRLNGFWSGDHFTARDGVHVGVVVSRPGGRLVAPALHHADTLELPRLMAALTDLSARARTGGPGASEAADATITVIDLGDQGVESVFGVLSPPRVAVAGFGRIVERPCAVDGAVGVRPTVTVTLSADHRAADGAVAARYLRAVDRLLQHPEEL
ncbi:dihydrolipoamide acetyltransferase family protein [Streptomyces halobius]|uniref:Dihydrolipoamide acetyltransferase component of pyruvate dehydrogenase complex n=1 Tax=Streptomyces halobius TaxID=2879846 RepID=A0ABY4LZM9_9ACTN|nr:dihydrolipoamide acetyltransferase family protein [Streptomyces halobius]UQA90954.1 2-oxo acid dehydrogenase subunit E2 [Streptomyces halobius]